MRLKFFSWLLPLMLACSAHAGAREDALLVVQKWAKAFGDADVDAITALYAPDALMFGTVDKTLATRPAEIRTYFERALLTGRPRTATLRDHAVAVLSDTVVVVTGLDTITATRDGQVASANGRVTFVIEKRPAGWQIVHLHRSPVPN